LLLNL
jgi:hypothetical protein